MGFLPVRTLAVIPAFFAAQDGGLDATPPLVVDELPAVEFDFCTGIRGFIGWIRDVVALETTCFLGEMAFAVALDLTGREVNASFVTAVVRDVVIGRVVMVVTVLVLAAG